MSATTSSPARIFALLARQEPVGVIFRRGPSKQVMLIKWNTRKDTFEYGQWLKGRVYERRCDLSPNGKLLIYFAASMKPPLCSWTAVSKPPYFTALALWPKGDCWNGGGWFLDNTRIRLNHGPTQVNLAPNFRLGSLKVAGYAEFRGEDDTVWDIVRERDGWVKTSEGKCLNRGGIKGWDLNPPQRWCKPHPKKQDITLEMSIVGVGTQDMPWYKIEYRVMSGADVLNNLGLADWADWDHRGDLVFAKTGCMFRGSFRKLGKVELVQIADFNDLKFEAIPPSSTAQRW